MRGFLRRLWRRLLRRDREPVRPPVPVADDPRLDPAERELPREVQIGAEETINASFGLPEVWRCPCGGRPFITERTCPRCGRPQGARWS